MVEHGAEVELPQLGEHLQASRPKILAAAQDWQGLGEVAANVDLVDFQQKCFKASTFSQDGILQPRLGMQTLKGSDGAQNRAVFRPPSHHSVKSKGWEVRKIPILDATF